MTRRPWQCFLSVSPIGSGKYAALLGGNRYGLALCMLRFWMPLWFRRRA